MTIIGSLTTDVTVAIETAATLLERERELSELDAALSEAQEAAAGSCSSRLPRGWASRACCAPRRTRRRASPACERGRTSSSATSPTAASGSCSSPPPRRRRTRRDRLFDGRRDLVEAALRAHRRRRRPSADSSFTMLHGLYWLLSNLADEGPVVLAVDDPHWADAESLRFLSYLAPRLDGLPVAVFASHAPGRGLAADLRGWPRPRRRRCCGRAPLSVEATAELCEQRLGAPVAPEFAAACREATGGNPFFLEELLREVRDQGRDATRAGRRACGASARRPWPRRCSCASPSARSGDRARARRGGPRRRRRPGRGGRAGRARPRTTPPAPPTCWSRSRS